jgi:5-methyltetrahydrofolate--homocysteine methyltransferase
METILRGKASTVCISPERPTVIIGERINPTGKKKLAEALSAGDLSLVQELAQAQVEAGAGVLDVNVGAAGVDEVALLSRAVEAVLEVVDVPVCVDTPSPEALAAALAVCPGKPLVNSVNGEEEKLEAVLPLVAERGAAVIGLLMDDDGIPPTPERRVAVARKIRDRAAALGIPAENIIFDPLMLAVGAEPQAGQIVLETVRLLRAELDANITVGASNVSFGMPERDLLNQTFIAMAIACGVNCPISHPARLCDTILAADVLLGRDEYGMRYIKACRARKSREREKRTRFQ